MKKNEVNNVNENIVMDEQTMQAVIKDNMHLVPKNQIKKFGAMTLKQQVAKIKFYQDIAAMREAARIKNSVPNKVKEMMEKRGTVDDAKQVIEYCQSFVDGYREKEIAKIDEKIRQLEIAKQLL